MSIDPKDRSELINSVALLVLDAQDCFIDTLHDKTGFISRCAFAIDAAQALGITTLFTEQVPRKLGHTNAKLLRRARAPKVFHKESFSALNAPGIERYLRDNEIYHLLVCGLETPICIYQTGLQAVDEDIDVTFLVDALGCRRADDAPHAIEALRRLGCQVLPTETLFYSLIGEVNHPRFRALNDLVKTFSQADFDIDAYLNQAPESAAPAQQPESSERHSERRDDDGPSADRPNRRRSRNRGRRRESPEHPEAEHRETKATHAASNETAANTDPSSSDKNSRQRPIKKEKPAGPKAQKQLAQESPAPATENAVDKVSPAPKIAKKATKKVARKRAAKKTAKKVAKKSAKKPAPSEA